MPLLYDLKMDMLDNTDIVETRRRNFTPLEVEALLRCVEKYKRIIENKVVNSKTNREKKVAWRLVGKEFNSTPGVGDRSVGQLMNLYKNLKQKAKTKKSVDNLPIMRTFGLIKEVKGSILSEENLVSVEADNNVSNQDSVLSSCHTFSNSSSKLEAVSLFEEESNTDEAEIASEMILMDMESSSADTHPIEKQSTEKTVENSEEQYKARPQNPIIHTVKGAKDSSLNQSMGLKEKLYREEHELNMKQRKEEHSWKKQKYELEIEDQKLKVKIHLEQLRLLKALNQKIDRDELLKFALNDINL